MSLWSLKVTQEWRKELSSRGKAQTEGLLGLLGSQSQPAITKHTKTHTMRTPSQMQAHITTVAPGPCWSQ